MFDSNNDNQIVMMATTVSQKTEKMVEYIRSLKTLEEAMEPYKEQKRELRRVQASRLAHKGRALNNSQGLSYDEE